MSLSGMRVFNAAVQQYRTSQENLAKIKEAKKKSKREEELFEIEKKKALLDIESKKHDGRMNDYEYDIHKRQVEDWYKQEKKRSEVKTYDQNEAEMKETQGLKLSRENMKSLVAQNPDVQRQIMGEVASQLGQVETEKGIGQIAAEEQAMAARGELVPVGRGASRGFKTVYPEKKKETIYTNTKEFQVNKTTQEIRKSFDNISTYDKMTEDEKISIARKSAKMIHYGRIDGEEIEETKEKYKKGEVHNFGAKGRWKYLGNDQWEEVD
ncbi:MAG: hypothetical protein U9O94_01325 [Nanoarchaeota archaeon]|nr:hypothetical protein [Nanoarchaeota archaeon]